MFVSYLMQGYSQVYYSAILPLISSLMLCSLVLTINNLRYPSPLLKSLLNTAPTPVYVPNKNTYISHVHWKLLIFRKHEWNRVIEETPFQFPTTQTLQVYLNSVFAMVSEIFENLIENDFRTSGAKKGKNWTPKGF